MTFLGPKRWNYFLPAFKAPKKQCKNGGVFLTSGLSLFYSPFPSLNKGENPCFPFFATLLSSSSNIHQQAPE